MNDRGYLRTAAGGLIGQNRDGTRHYHLHDGSIVALIDTSATVSNTYSYDPWGVATATGSVTNPWQYASGYRDAATGLIKFGTRYYEPILGRWTQLDPSGIDQHYVYASNDPVNFIDPSGRFDLTALCGVLCINYSDGEPECSNSPEGIRGVYDFHDECLGHDSCYDRYGANTPYWRLAISLGDAQRLRWERHLPRRCLRLLRHRCGEYLGPEPLRNHPCAP